MQLFASLSHSNCSDCCSFLLIPVHSILSNSAHFHSLLFNSLPSVHSRVLLLISDHSCSIPLIHAHYSSIPLIPDYLGTSPLIPVHSRWPLQHYSSQIYLRFKLSLAIFAKFLITILSCWSWIDRIRKIVCQLLCELEWYYWRQSRPLAFSGSLFRLPLTQSIYKRI